MKAYHPDQIRHQKMDTYVTIRTDLLVEKLHPEK